MSIVNLQIANNVLDGIIGLNGVRRNFDSSTDERRCIKLTPADIETYKGVFKYNGGIMSDSKYIRLKDIVYYVKIPVNFSMIEQNDNSIVDPNVETLEERGLRGVASLQVFVDGLKIPDSEVKMYPTKSNVDVLIPEKYIDGVNGNEIVVEKRRYDLYRYVHYYAKKTSDQSIVIPLNGLDENLIKERTVQVYINRKLYGNSRYVKASHGEMQLDITTEVDDAEIEIIVDPYVMYYFAYSALSRGDKPIYEIPETYIDSIHGPISRFSCMFYVNGLRIGNTNVEQSGRLHFTYPVAESDGGSVSFYLSDRNQIIDTDAILYGSDYYLYNFIGCNAVTKALRTSLSGNKYIDAGAHRSVSNIEVTYSFGSNKIIFYLPEDFLYDKENAMNITIFNKVVNQEDIEIDSASTPNKIIISNPSKYMTQGTTSYASVEVKSWFSWDEVLNRNGDLFSRELIKDVIKVYESGVDHSTRVANALVDRPYLLRTFLENYGYQRFIQEIEYNGTDTTVTVGVPETIDLSVSRNFDISVNNKHVPSDSVNIIDKDLTNIFEIDSTLFNPGTNEVEIQVYDNISCEYKEFDPSQIKNHDGVNILEINGFFSKDRLGEIDQNIIILEKVDNTDSEVKTFIDGSDFGYKMFNDFTPMYDSESDTLFIVFDRGIPDHKFVVYNKNYSVLYRYTKPLDTSIADVVVPLYMGTSINPIPYIARGKIFVYSGSDRLVEGTDYFIKTPDNLRSVGCSFLILRRAVIPGQTIDIYFTDIKTTVIYNKTGYFTNNNYGLFYFSSLKFPFSLSYMNMYVNGQKLSEEDVDILSDKMVRVHSLPVPLYDLSIESAFTVELTQLQPFINEYHEDNFELYLASLFKSVSYDRQFAIDEEAFDPNEVYKSFIDTVDSVNKRPNPKSREGLWIPSYNDDPEVIGPHSEGDVVLGNTINASVILGSTYIVGADNGKVASCVLDNVSCDWTPCDFDSDSGTTPLSNIYSNGEEFNNEDITAMIVYKGYVIFGTREGHVVCFNPTTNEWKNDASFPMCDTKWPEGVRINGFIINDTTDSLYMYGDDGTVDSYSFELQKWNGVDNHTLYPENIGITGFMGDIHGAILANRLGHQVLILFGEDGQMASCYIEFDTWIRPDGTKVYNVGIAPNIFNDGSYRDNKDIYAVVKYNGDYVLLGEDGVVSYYSSSSFTCSNEDLSKISNTGAHVGNENVNDAIVFDGKVIVTGAGKGRVSSYFGESYTWYSYNSDGSGISSDGHHMEMNTINTVQKTQTTTNYIIFAGENGKVCSYNVDIDESPFRYDPYKTTFLKWYNTPGNAVIRSRWDIPDEIASMFDMYKEGNENGDIAIRGGDNDLMSEIDMNDDEKYPWSVAARKRFISNFIKSLPEGRYTPDEVEELFRESIASKMCYPEDLEMLSFASGDETDSDEDILLTQI